MTREYRLEYRFVGAPEHIDSLYLQGLVNEKALQARHPDLFTDSRILYRDVPDWHPLEESEAKDGNS